jgi:hypothetical protein
MKEGSLKMRKKSFLALLMIFVLLTAFSSAAEASTTEPALIFKVGSDDNVHAYIKDVDGNLEISVYLENQDPNVDIDAFDLEVYCVNVYGEVVFPEDEDNSNDSEYIQTFTLLKTVKAGKSTYSGYCLMDGFSDYDGVRYLYVAIKRYHYADKKTKSDGYIMPDDNNTVTIGDDDLAWTYWTYE